MRPVASLSPIPLKKSPNPPTRRPSVLDSGCLNTVKLDLYSPVRKLMIGAEI
jgi:hypothetical protein